MKKLICLVFVLPVIFQGLDAAEEPTCKSLAFEQKGTGKMVNNKPEWHVTVIFDCDCFVVGVKLDCKGFRTVEPIDTAILAVEGDVCLLRKGRSIRRTDSINFKYAWDTQFKFNVVESLYGCE